jgi:predicted ester cyclase
MSPNDNKKTIRTFIEEFQGRRNLGIINDYLTPEFVDHTAPPGAPKSREGVTGFFSQFYAAFPDFHAIIHDQVAEGNKVVTRKTFHGTHRGEFLGIPATGREIAVDVFDILELSDGKVISHWGILDQLGLMQQLGVVPAESAAN